MSDNSAWWVLLPVLCVGAAIVTVVLVITFVVRRVARGTTNAAFNATRGGGQFRHGGSGASPDNPFGPGWTPDGGGSGPAGFPGPSDGHGGHGAHGGHVHGWGHGMDHGHHGHDSGSSWSSSDSGSSSSSDSGSSSSSDSGSSSSSSSD